MPAQAYAHQYSTSPRRHNQEHTQNRPDVHVVRGHQSQAESPDILSTVAKIGLILLLCFMVIGFIRVTIASASYTLAAESHELSAAINTMRSESSTLEVQKSLVASPSNLRTVAADELGMAAPTTTESLVLGADIICVDERGNLSLGQSLAAAANQG